MTSWFFLLLCGGLVFWGLNKLIGKLSPSKTKTIVELKPRVDYGPRLAELRAKIKLKAEGVQAQTRTVDGVVTTTHTAPEISIPIAVKMPSNSMPVEVSVLTLQTSLIFERDEVLADLNRRATDAKVLKDWQTAVALLQQAKKREGSQYRDTRLAMYLQQAGRFDEALAEFNWLLSMAPEQCDSSVAPMSAAFRSSSIARMNALIHNKIRIAASREKRADLVSKHQILHEQYQTEVEKLEPVIDREWKKERRSYAAKEAKLAKKRQARVTG